MCLYLSFPATSNVHATMSAILNIADLMNRLGNDREFLLELIAIFKTECPSHVQRLREAVALGDCAKVETESHALKGMLLALSATRAAVAANELEDMGHFDQIVGMSAAFEAFGREVKELLVEMDGCVNEIQS